MPLRERERFLKLSDKELEECQPGEAGWMSTWETADGMAELQTTTDLEKTIEAIKTYLDDEEANVEVRWEGDRWWLALNGQRLSFEETMEIVNNFH